MGDRSKIEWCDASWNPIRARNQKTGKVGWHCEHACEACRFCYAESMNRRLGTGLEFKPGHRADIEIFLDREILLQPLKWKRPRAIFAGSMTDLFADFVPTEWLDEIFAVAALASTHRFMFLTKRAERLRQYLTVDQLAALSKCPEARIGRAAMAIARARGERVDDPWWDAWWEWPLPNIWLGVSAGEQKTADERIPLLLKTPAATRFLSGEPLLGPLDIFRYLVGEEEPGLCGNAIGWTPPIDWVIAGGESGREARPMHPQWARSMRDQCARAGVPFFFKQWGEWLPGIEADKRSISERQTIAVNADMQLARLDGKASDPRDRIGEFVTWRVGKKAAGRLLDGREWSEFPR